MSISDAALRALHNLADKHNGQDVDWISISDARVLTELGLARRTRSGWEITPEGLSMVAEAPARTAGPASVSRPWPPARDA